MGDCFVESLTGQSQRQTNAVARRAADLFGHCCPATLVFEVEVGRVF